MLAYTLVLGVGRTVFVRLMKWPFLAVLGGVICQVLIASSGVPMPDGRIAVSPVARMMALIIQLGTAMVVLPGLTAWLRWVVDPRAPVEFRLRRAEWVTLGRLIQIYVLAILALLAIGVLVVLALGLILSPAAGPHITDIAAGGFEVVGLGITGIAATILALAIPIAVLVRYGLSPVAAALGAPSDLRAAAQAGRPARWHLFWTLVLFMPTSLAAMLPFMVAGLIIVTALAAVASSPFMTSIWGNVILSALYIPIGLSLYGVLAAIFCLYYRWLVLKDLSH